MIKGKVFLTGGSGTLGKAILKRGHEENWPCEFTVFSRDPVKQFPLKKKYPNVNFMIGDVTDFGALTNAIAGHDIVLHLAAQKHIPTGEFDVMQTIQVNLQGSINVAEACLQNLVKKVVAISTDKAVHPVNTYGATKYLMEKVFQEYAFISPKTTKFNLVRYGNVLGSTGSVIQVWRKMEKEGKVYATDPDMTRFWLTVDQAVDVVLLALEDPIPSGTIVIPQCGSTTMGDLAGYVIAEYVPIEYTGVRPGEKRHEELLGKEESRYAAESMMGDWILLAPTTTEPKDSEEWDYVSDNRKRFTKEEVLDMIGE